MMRIRAWYTQWDGDVCCVLDLSTQEGTILSNIIDECLPDIEVVESEVLGRNPIVACRVTEDPTSIEQWLEHGCNAVRAEKPVCRPLSVWTDEDVVNYFKLI
jgi:hypothetical protein